MAVFYGDTAVAGLYGGADESALSVLSAQLSAHDADIKEQLSAHDADIKEQLSAHDARLSTYDADVRGRLDGLSALIGSLSAQVAATSAGAFDYARSSYGSRTTTGSVTLTAYADGIVRFVPDAPSHAAIYLNGVQLATWDSNAGIVAAQADVKYVNSAYVYTIDVKEGDKTILSVNSDKFNYATIPYFKYQPWNVSKMECQYDTYGSYPGSSYTRKVWKCHIYGGSIPKEPDGDIAIFENNGPDANPKNLTSWLNVRGYALGSIKSAGETLSTFNVIKI